MIIFEINEQEYHIKELSLRDYYDLKMKLLAVNEEDTFELVTPLTDCPQALLRLLPYENWLSIVIAVQEEVNKALGLIKVPFETKFYLGDIEYGLINFEQMTLGEFLDLDILVTSPQAEWKLHEMLSILFRPIIDDNEDGGYIVEPYSNERSAKRAELFKDIPMSQVRLATGFFLDSVKMSLHNILESSLQEMKQGMTLEAWTRLRAIAMQLLEAGSMSSTSLLKKTRLGSTQPRSFTSGQPLTGSLGKSTKQQQSDSNTRRLFPNINVK